MYPAAVGFDADGMVDLKQRQFHRGFIGVGLLANFTPDSKELFREQFVGLLLVLGVVEVNGISEFAVEFDRRDFAVDVVGYRTFPHQNSRPK